MYVILDSNRSTRRGHLRSMMASEAQRPLFSVCIPNYNYAKYIGETIQSVLDQRFQNFEIIVADNASTDGSVKVVEAFRSPKINIIQNRYNVGFSPNLDRATERARGEHLILL